jgi:hypothetical protein
MQVGQDKEIRGPVNLANPNGGSEHDSRLNIPLTPQTIQLTAPNSLEFSRYEAIVDFSKSVDVVRSLEMRLLSGFRNDTLYIDMISTAVTMIRLQVNRNNISLMQPSLHFLWRVQPLVRSTGLACRRI